MASRRRRSNSSSLVVEQITLPPAAPVAPALPKVTLKNQGLSMRSDHLRMVRFVSMDLYMDDYEYSASFIHRCAVARFLALPMGEQIKALEHYKKEEKKVLRGR